MPPSAGRDRLEHSQIKIATRQAGREDQRGLRSDQPTPGHGGSPAGGGTPPTLAHWRPYGTSEKSCQRTPVTEDEVVVDDVGAEYPGDLDVVLPVSLDGSCLAFQLCPVCRARQAGDEDGASPRSLPRLHFASSPGPVSAGTTDATDNRGP